MIMPDHVEYKPSDENGQPIDETEWSVMRLRAAAALVPLMRATGFRFSKDYRHEITEAHSEIYAHVDTVAANLMANGVATLEQMEAQYRGNHRA